MSAPILKVLRAQLCEVTRHGEVGHYRSRVTRLFDANGTEFVGVSQVSTSADPHDSERSLITVTMSLRREDIEFLEEPPSA